MTQFLYTARAIDNNEAFGSTCYANNEVEIRSELKRMGYTVDTVKLQKISQVFGRRKRVKLVDLVNMCRRFAVMYSAGLPLLDCLSSLVRENESKNLSDALMDIHTRIERGSNIADAFSKHPRIFSPLFVNLLRAGEASGKFDYVLSQLAGFMEKEYDLKRKIRQAFAYPIVVLVMIFLVVAAIMIVVVPVFSKVYTEMGVPLPGPTIALIAISNNAGYIFPSIIVLAVGLWFLLRKLRTVPAAKNRLDRWKLSMPMGGAVYQKVVLLKFIRTLSVMITAGIRLSDAINISENVADNAVISEATNMIQRNIKRGGTITEVIKLHGFFPQTIIHAFSAGEEAGKLDEMLGKFANGIEQDVDDGIKRLVTKVEPLLVVVLSLVVGFILLAIYLPIFDLMKVLHK
ncbi:MAG: type II secretion system F family protein [Phycisphaerae bacterium]|nr:type II secretion system F family protein [Phycisphaerae bacterium]